MGKFKPTLKEKRFLIIWILICLFALFLNLANVGGKIEFPEGREYFLFFYSHEEHGSAAYDDDFYPFTEFFKESIRYPSNYPNLIYHRNPGNLFNNSYTIFNGIFNSYNFPEFIFYTILGLCIVFIPKIWKP